MVAASWQTGSDGDGDSSVADSMAVEALEDGAGDGVMG